MKSNSKEVERGKKEKKKRKEREIKTYRNHLPYFLFCSLTSDRKPCQETYAPQTALNYIN